VTEAEPPASPALDGAAGPPVRDRRTAVQRSLWLIVLAMAGSLAAISWLVVGPLIWAYVQSQHAGDGSATWAAAIFLTFALFAAFGLSSIAAFAWHHLHTGRIARVVGLVCAFAAFLSPCVWWGAAVAIGAG
jgi:hypothetical protein